jgi:hypothetical protein
VTLGLFGKLADGSNKGYDQNTFFWIINNINFQYFSILITIISALVMVGVSYMSAAPDYAKIKNMSFGTRTDDHLAESAKGWDWRDIAASAFVLIVILMGYIYFTG